MDPIQAKFFSSSFEIEFKSQKITLKGLISDQGITKIFFPAEALEEWRHNVGQEVTVRMESLKVTGILTQQFVEHGTFYEIRFRSIDENQKHFIRQRVGSEGVSPGWQRQFPRINVDGGVRDPDLPVPNLCMVRFAGKEYFVNVLNFTLGGLRIETIGDSLKEIRVGAVIHFDLVTNTGVILANLSGEVRNMSTHEHEGKGVTRSFGIRFVNMDPVNERKYRELIKDYCLELQKRIGEKKS